MHTTWSAGRNNTAGEWRWRVRTGAGQVTGVQSHPVNNTAWVLPSPLSQMSIQLANSVNSHFQVSHALTHCSHFWLNFMLVVQAELFFTWNTSWVAWSPTASSFSLILFISYSTEKSQSRIMIFDPPNIFSISCLTQHEVPMLTHTWCWLELFSSSLLLPTLQPILRLQTTARDSPRTSLSCPSLSPWKLSLLEPPRAGDFNCPSSPRA